MLIYYCIYVILVITNMQSYIDNAELIKQTILTCNNGSYNIDIELVTKNKNTNEYINTLHIYTSIAQTLIDIIIEYTNDVKKINITYTSYDNLITVYIPNNYCRIEICIAVFNTIIVSICEGKLSAFKSVLTINYAADDILLIINQFVNSEYNDIDMNRACVFFNTYMNYKYSITDYFENIKLSNIDHCCKLEINYNKFSMIAYGKDNTTMDHVVTVENPEQFEEIIHTTKLFYDLFNK